jgi:flagellar hook-basal body complex protein FliE
MATNAFAAGAYAATQGLTGLGGAAKGLSGAAKPQTGMSFAGLVEESIASVAQAGRNAEAQATAVARGKADVVDVVTAVAESEAALETLVALRDRVIAAYEEMMRMPV